MAGDWIKIEHTTPEKPEVFAMAEILGIDPDHVMGVLVRLWVWADQQLTNGNAVGVTKTAIDRKANVTGFTDALVSVGWCSMNDASVVFNNFDYHNGKSAKERAVTNRRVARHRAKVTEKSSIGNDDCNADTVTNTVTREEKRREDIKEKNNKKKKASPRFVKPTVDQVAAYCRERGNNVNPQQFADHYTANGWRVGKNPMKDWKAAVRTWERNHETRQSSPAGRRADIAEKIDRDAEAAAATVLGFPAVRQVEGDLCEPLDPAVSD